MPRLANLRAGESALVIGTAVFGAAQKKMVSSPAGEGAGMVENTEELVLIVEWRNVSHPKKSDEGNRTSTRYPTAYLIVTVSFFSLPRH